MKLLKKILLLLAVAGFIGMANTACETTPEGPGSHPPVAKKDPYWKSGWYRAVHNRRHY